MRVCRELSALLYWHAVNQPLIPHLALCTCPCLCFDPAIPFSLPPHPILFSSRRQELCGTSRWGLQTAVPVPCCCCCCFHAQLLSLHPMRLLQELLRFTVADQLLYCCHAGTGHAAFSPLHHASTKLATPPHNIHLRIHPATPLTPLTPLTPDPPSPSPSSSQREEPVLYINGRPYVLREAGRPFKNLLEYHGIVAERLESMEARLRVGGWPVKGVGCGWLAALVCGVLGVLQSASGFPVE